MGGLVLWDNSERGVKERGLGVGRRGDSQPIRGQFCSWDFPVPPARLTGHWMHAVHGEKAYFWMRQVSLAKGNLQGRSS